MALQTLQPPTNPYSQKIKLSKVKSETLFKTITQNIKDMKNANKKVSLGEDSKVDESILISIISTMFNDFTKTYDFYKKYFLDNKIKKLEAKEKTLKEVYELKEKIDKYTQLQIEKNMEEKKLQNPEISSKEKDLTLKKLKNIIDNMQEIAEFFGYKDDSSLKEEVERAEKKWYGEEVASVLKDFRDLNETTIASFEQMDLLNNFFETPLNMNEVTGVIDKIKQEILPIVTDELKTIIEDAVDETKNKDLEQS
ncbi:hypothetical protein [Aliarcobacter butzleri]|uniref:hypothetical protein n=1 Tax=Aliarcobacter butzleri TaxID=28197 RepID=UPI002B2529BC|nr:hypothetical protein [Aliarcobacter butzleri]